MLIVPISTSRSMTFSPLVDPRNTRLLVSQARLDGPRTHLCFGPCCRGKWLPKPLSLTRQEPDKTTHFTICRWFSFRRQTTTILFRNARSRKNKSVQSISVWETLPEWSIEWPTKTTLRVLQPLLAFLSILRFDWTISCLGIVVLQLCPDYTTLSYHFRKSLRTFFDMNHFAVSG